MTDSLYRVHLITNVMKRDVSVMTTPPDQPKGWHPQDIKGAVWKRGTTLSKLAKDNGLPESHCRASLLRPQPAADRVISAFLDVPLHVLWPDRYDEEGGQIRHVRDEPTPDRDRAHRLSARVG
ncbi:MAG: helix-turn-helix domain-containing protein [Brevundimonas sp.]|uniref:helix-turn-helix domain-containing protein n=1 Tax=Brevundimonas sp. TaxID=1871086 RepID=UPI002ABA274D|nr:helix-turn-helix domain-containing protein [Brevundimonas sp.]MDZ4111707.1 helix-turn-helix domain-containing protein [Brevundimonas sp.]